MDLFNFGNHPQSLFIFRYIETGYHISSWYRMTPWDTTTQANTDSVISIEIVNKYHQDAATLCRKYSREERRERAVAIIEKLPPITDVRRKLYLDGILFQNLSDIKEAQFKEKRFELYEKYINSEVAFSQMDMALVQAAFFASFTAFPDHFGAQHASDEELCSFVHVWRVIGYYLGLKDEYNLARLKNIEDTRDLLIDLGNEFVIPSFLNLDSISLHMLKSISEAFGIDYHLAMYRHAYAHGFELKLLWHNFSFKQKYLYYLSKTIDFVYSNIFFVKRFINNIYKKYSDKMHEQKKKDMLKKISSYSSSKTNPVHNLF